MNWTELKVGDVVLVEVSGNLSFGTVIERDTVSVLTDLSKEWVFTDSGRSLSGAVSLRELTIPEYLIRDRVTREKAEAIVGDGFHFTGMVLTSERGRSCIVDNGAVRWLSQEEMWWVMHDSAQHDKSLMQ